MGLKATGEPSAVLAKEGFGFGEPVIVRLLAGKGGRVPSLEQMSLQPAHREVSLPHLTTPHGVIDTELEAK